MMIILYLFISSTSRDLEISYSRGSLIAYPSNVCICLLKNQDGSIVSMGHRDEEGMEEDDYIFLYTSLLSLLTVSMH